MVSKLTLPNSQVWNYFLSLQSLKHSIVLFAIRNILQFYSEGEEEEKKGVAGAEVLFTRALTLGRGVTGF